MSDVSFAEVAAVHTDGLSLIWPGEAEPTAKHYKCNTVAVFAVGQRVFCVRDSGSWVVICPVGAPMTGASAQTATAAGVSNTGTHYKDIQLRAQYSNQLEYRVAGQETWVILQNQK